MCFQSQILGATRTTPGIGAGLGPAGSERTRCRHRYGAYPKAGGTACSTRSPACSSSLGLATPTRTPGAISPPMARSGPSAFWRASTTSVQSPRPSSPKPVGRVGGGSAEAIKPPPRLSGTSAPKFPNRCISAHIPAISDRACRQPRCETPASCYIRGARFQVAPVIAMQKVVGSNPISRFNESPAPAGLSRSGAGIDFSADHLRSNLCARLRPISTATCKTIWMRTRGSPMTSRLRTCSVPRRRE
jgi:hypothetical protein